MYFSSGISTSPQIAICRLAIEGLYSQKRRVFPDETDNHVPSWMTGFLFHSIGKQSGTGPGAFFERILVRLELRH
jgi:hypothetical protein